ncbi:MAG: hypothetical protein QY323_03765 [Patescibacteria group bacterium]|nr:MAG: hypothetical protein QY323_03765 [Patescibacteria group bacterium]
MADSVELAESTGVVVAESYSDVEDGVSYFHIRTSNSAGWGPTTHYRVQVDTKPPEAFAVTVETGLTTLLKAAAKDATSGIASYIVQVDDGESVEVDMKQLEAGTYVLENLPAGAHSVLVTAYDKAGNFTSTTASFTSVTAQAPVIAEYPAELSDGDVLTLKGTTYPNAQLSIWLQRDSKDIQRYTLKADENGAFTFVGPDRVKGGLYQVWMEAVTDQGFRTDVSKPIFVNVKQTEFWRRLAELQKYLTVIVPIVALTMTLVLVMLHGVQKAVRLRRRIHREIGDVEGEIHKAFDTLRTDLRDHLKSLEKARNQRELTPDEEKIAARLKKNLDLAEKALKKTVEKIEKDV